MFRRILFIAALVIAGEMVFGLPFHVSRFFRPTMLDVFGFSNTQLGDLFAVYGITAMVSYFPGGVLADHFSARRLIAASLVATGLGGFYMASIPSAIQMALLYGFWGVTTIFMLWGAMIRATREWGGDSSQGAAFGILESGRGLTAAIVASIAAIAFAILMPDDATLASDEERLRAFRAVIFLYSAFALAAGLLAWLVIPESTAIPENRLNPFRGMLQVVGRPIIWAQALIIVCAYCCYKGSDNYSLYAVQVLGMDEVDAARLTAVGSYVRPIAALAAGLIADRLSAKRSIGAAFGLLILAYVALSTLTPDMVGIPIIVANIFVALFAVFALRGIYFALLEETSTPRHITGTAVGMISLVGYTPEVFFASVAGRILDATPGAGGHMNLFTLLAVIAAVGVAVVLWLIYLQRNKVEPVPVS
ncbi:MAG: MFS transporter [Woeseiaceae bacterium]